MDTARQECGVDKAVAEFGVSGRGVLVAIMDRGIDWANPDFRNADGSTRIESIFDLTDDSGAKEPQNRFGAGTIYTKERIGTALRTGEKLHVMDATGHGTSTAGIACGSGRGSPGTKYRGIAPQASLLVVKICSDGTAGKDGRVRQPYFWKPERVPMAIDFIEEKARELKMPCVMVLNIGSQGRGPADGTSELCRKIDNCVGPGKPGLVFVTGPGDEGTNRKHKRMTAVNGQPMPVGTIWDGASARHNICPGDYVIHTHWKDIDGKPQSNAKQGSVGEIWKLSGVGPTADGRIGIDFCVPADSVFTTYDPKSAWATNRGNLIHDGGGRYGRAGAVSAANPMTAGIIALLLEVYPRLDALAAKRILQLSCRRDQFTGNVPNCTWGYGKLDAYQAIKMTKQAF